jgi:transposase
VFFRRIARRKHHNVAVVATARKLVVIALLMLKGREPYRYSLPEPTPGCATRISCVLPSVITP